IGVKLVVLLAVGRLFKMCFDNNILFALALAQGGEFAFVLFSSANQLGVVSKETTAPLIAAVALSMAATPLLMLLNEWLIQPRFGTTESASARSEEIKEGGRVIIAGHGRFGQIAGRLLRSKGFVTTILDHDSEQVEATRKFGMHSFYGDAGRRELLSAAGADEAELLLLAIDDDDKALEIVHTAQKHFPHLRVLARARGRLEAYRLHDAGVKHIFRETFDSAISMGTSALRELGVPAHTAYRAGRSFKHHDEELFERLAGMREDQQEFTRASREALQLIEQTLRVDRKEGGAEGGDAWDSSSLRRELLEDAEAA
ncbi:MAG: NAD-binding protein, partial [Myxococcota bacterium]